MNKNAGRGAAFLAFGAVLLAAWLASATPETGARRLAVPQATGSIMGTVVFEGTPPHRNKLDTGSDPLCAAKNPNPVLAEDGAVNPNGTLPNAFVYLKDVSGTFKPPAQPVVMDQRNCMYVPHVFGVMAGQELQVVSSDATTHNIHFMPKANRDWNKSQPPGASPLSLRFPHPEIMIPVHCNEHPWMSAYAAVTSNPFYAVTGTDGAFTIQAVPPGDYSLSSWTATLGTQEQKVTVRAGQSAHVTFTFSTK
jgi:hypothetical protein